MLKQTIFIFNIFLILIDYHHQIINAAEQSMVNFIKPLHYLIQLHLNPNVNEYYGNVKIKYLALKPFNQTIVDGILNNMQLIEPSDTATFNKRRNGKLQYMKYNRYHFENITYTVEIDFQNAFNKDNYGIYKNIYSKSSYIATQFEPIYARHGFPCFDHPAMKAEFELIIERPRDYKSLSNMPIYRTHVSPHTPGHHIDYFQKSVKMSSYLLAFCVSKFENLTDGNISIWARKEILHDTKISLQYLSDILQFFGTYFNFTYNLPKLDVIAVPQSYTDGMENWGIITISERRLIENQLTSYDDKQFRKLLLTHEIAHQWIGNVITHDWWDDIWFTEGMTTYFEYIGVDGIMPQLKIWDSYGIDVLQYCLELDISDNNFNLHKTLSDDNVSFEAAFHIFTYRKGSAIIRMFANVAPAYAFQELMRNIIEKYAFSTITVDNFFKMLADTIITYVYDKTNNNEQYIGRMRSWILNTGYPLVTVNVSRNPFMPTTFHQERYGVELNVNNSFKYWIPILYTTSEYMSFNNAKSILWMSNETEIVWKDKVFVHENEWLLINLFQTGYYRVNYDNENWNAIINYLNNESTFSNIPVANRIQLLDDAFEMASKNKINVTIPLNLIKYIKHETEFNPWRAAGKQFNMLLNVMRFKPQYEYLKNFINECIVKVYMNLGFTNAEDANEYRGSQRVYILQLACAIERKHCVDKSIELFRSLYDKLIYNIYKIDFNPIELNHREFIYCKAMANVDERKWYFIHNNINLMELDKDIVLFAMALTCTQNAALLESLLYEYFVEGKPPVSETKINKETILTLILRNPIGYDVLYNFLWTFVDEIKLRLTRNCDLMALLDVPIKYLYYKYQVNNYERLLRKYFNSSIPVTTLELLKLQKAAVTASSSSFGDIEHFLNIHEIHFI